MSISRKIRAWRKYVHDRAAFLAAGGLITKKHAIYDDYVKPAGRVGGHYFHQDLLVASFISQACPQVHVDVGSSIEGFVAHVASFRTIDVIDIRPLTDIGHPQIRFRQGNLMNLDSSLVGICDSLSCLHALEHFGLGRYGDPIDPAGHLKGFENLSRMLKPGGTLYLSFPIGQAGVHFNAHRVFDANDVLSWSKGIFELMRFDFVDDDGHLHCQANLSNPPKLNYGCGIYTLRKLT